MKKKERCEILSRKTLIQINNTTLRKTWIHRSTVGIKTGGLREEQGVVFIHEVGAEIYVLTGASDTHHFVRRFLDGHGEHSRGRDVYFRQHLSCNALQQPFYIHSIPD